MRRNKLYIALVTFLFAAVISCKDATQHSSKLIVSDSLAIQLKELALLCKHSDDYSLFPNELIDESLQKIVAARIKKIKTEQIHWQFVLRCFGESDISGDRNGDYCFRMIKKADWPRNSEFMVRINKANEHTKAILTIKKLSDYSTEEKPIFLRHSSRPLTDKEWDMFTKLIWDSYFWNTYSNWDIYGCSDCGSWTFECTQQLMLTWRKTVRKYHKFDSWGNNLRTMKPVYNYLTDLAGEDLNAYNNASRNRGFASGGASRDLKPSHLHQRSSRLTRLRLVCPPERKATER